MSQLPPHSFSDCLVFLLPKIGDIITAGGVEYANTGTGIVYSQPDDTWNVPRITRDLLALIEPRADEFTAFMRIRDAAPISALSITHRCGET